MTVMRTACDILLFVARWLRGRGAGAVRILPVSVVAVLLLGAAPALAAASNVYKGRFDGAKTAGGGFYPGALAFDGGGEVYVSDGEHSVVDRFEAGPSGEPVPLKEINGDGTAAAGFYSEGIAVNSSGDLFVADEYTDAVYEFEPDGTLLREITGVETGAKSFLPIGVALGPGGDLYVADYDGGVVDVFTPAAYEAATTGEPELEIPVNEPAYLAIAPTTGDIYVSGYDGVLHEFEPDGTPMAFSGAGTPQEEKGESVSLGAVAVAPSGEVYVADNANEVVDRYSESGEYQAQLGGSEAFSYIAALAVNASGEVYVADGGNHTVDIYSAPHEIVNEPQWVTEAASSVGVTMATLKGTVNPEGGAVTACEFEYGTSNSYGHPEPCEQSKATIGEGTSKVAVSANLTGLEPNTTYHYRLTGTGAKGPGHGSDETFTTQAAPRPSAVIHTASAVAQNSATFNGEVNPHEAQTAYHFEYSTDAVHWTALAEQSAGNGPSAVHVTQNATGLTGNTTYHVRLVAHNSGGTTTSTEEPFTTLAGPPKVSGTAATDITAGEATLYATIYPEDAPAAYRFEFGTTNAYGTTVPVGEGHVGSAPSQVSQAIKGLTPDTTYHFRLVANNGVGTPTSTPDQTFTTYPNTETPATCPNEQLRSESNINPITQNPYSTQLPDCRAYEQVTPPFKDGAFITLTPGISQSGVQAIFECRLAANVQLNIAVGDARSRHREPGRWRVLCAHAKRRRLGLQLPEPAGLAVAPLGPSGKRHRFASGNMAGGDAFATYYGQRSLPAHGDRRVHRGRPGHTACGQRRSAAPRLLRGRAH